MEPNSPLLLTDASTTTAETVSKNAQPKNSPRSKPPKPQGKPSTTYDSSSAPHKPQGKIVPQAWHDNRSKAFDSLLADESGKVLPNGWRESKLYSLVGTIFEEALLKGKMALRVHVPTSPSGVAEISPIPEDQRFYEFLTEKIKSFQTSTQRTVIKKADHGEEG